MKQLQILYLHKAYSDAFSERIRHYIYNTLSSRYFVNIYSINELNEHLVVDKMWDLIIHQDAISEMWHSSLFEKLNKIPCLFFSTHKDVDGFLTPFAGLFKVFNMSKAKLSDFGIPSEMQIDLAEPVELVENYYLHEKNPLLYQIVYYPTKHNASNHILTLIQLLHSTNTSLTIVSDDWAFAENIFPSFVTRISSNDSTQVLKEAHLVIASGYDAIQAMALCKPCVVLGEYGLGGFVTPDKFYNLHSMSFEGRKGACFDEFVPTDLLEVEIRKAIAYDYSKEMVNIQELILSIYDSDKFDNSIFDEIEKIMNLSDAIKCERRRLYLKPILSSTFFLEEIEGKQYIKYLLGGLCEVDYEMVVFLGQCNGSSTLGELIESNKYEKDDVFILWENLYELWSEKLILFEL